MPEQDVKRIAENANFVVCFYVFTGRADGFISILNLYHPECTIETNKDK